MNKLLAVVVLMIFSVSACSQDVKVKVYFSNSVKDPDMHDCSVSFPVERTVPKTDSLETTALNELFKGVTKEEEKLGFGSWPAKDTKGILKSVNLKNRIAYVNFNQVIYEQMGNATSSCGSGYFAHIEQTLKQFDTVDKVFFAIEGNPLDFYDWIQVGECPEGLEDCDGTNFK